jgi:uncharacterized peroxidase-related enzyme
MSERKFTMDALEWEPWIEPVDFSAATQEQRDSLKVTPSNMSESAYSLVLAHDPEALAQRTPLYNAIMYAPRGLPRPDRELGALAASYVNGCVYCASVHSRRFVELTKRPEIVDHIYEKGVEAELDERRQAVFDFAVKLTRSPPSAGAADLDALRRVGLTELDILDLTNAVAMFAWANRLMQTLGEPVELASSERA